MTVSWLFPGKIERMRKFWRRIDFFKNKKIYFKTYIGSSSSFSNGLKKYDNCSSVTSLIFDGFHFGLLSLRTSTALTPATTKKPFWSIHSRKNKKINEPSRKSLCLIMRWTNRYSICKHSPSDSVDPIWNSRSVSFKHVGDAIFNV